MTKNFSKLSVSNAQNLRNNSTVPEKILWNYLRKSQLNGLKFRRQQPIGKYIVDFLCCSEKIIIELDGGQHNNPKDIKYDKIRDEFLKNEGYSIIRIWNNEILNNIENVMEYLDNVTKTPTRKSEISTLPSREGNKVDESCQHDYVHSTTSREDSDPKRIKIQCPAKINLTLKITGKRDDGFHNIDSIMQTISLFDYLIISVEKSDKLEINLSGTSTEIPYNEKNLVYKAAMLFLDKVKTCHPNCAIAGQARNDETWANIPDYYAINIFIEKNIPIAAGLAGGSTDAAGTLYGLNKLLGEPLSRNELHKLCAQLGSDLNLCLEGGRQKTSGRGEILEPAEFEEFEVSLIKPLDLGISAKEAYTKFAQKTKDSSRDEFVNDLEWAVIDDYKQLQDIKKAYPKSIMSGSGSTYFGIGFDFENKEGFWVQNGLKSIPYGVTKINPL